MSPDDDEDASKIVATTLEQSMSPAELELNLAAFLAMALEILHRLPSWRLPKRSLP